MSVRRVAVVGAGINGLAVARQLMLDRPDTSLTVFEKEDDLAQHQSSHNSGVVHAGLYYEPGSLKARLCARGVELVRDYCSAHDLPYDECGKLVVALAEDASVVAVISVPVFGWLCDRFSSRTVLIVGGVAAALFGYVFMTMLETAQPGLIYAALIVGTGIVAPMMFAPQGSFLSRQFPVHVRSTGVGTAREIGTAIAGGFAPLGALAMVAESPTHSTAGVIAILIASGALVSIAAWFDQGFRFSKEKN